MNPSALLDSFGDPRRPDTICAIATPPGLGGIGIIRLSGPEALSIADRMFHGKHLPSQTPSHRILFGRFRDPETGVEIDEVVLSVFRSPNSYTGEDIVELSFHGSPAILGSALGLLAGHGARIAQPGEFTFRAFCNGRIDLTQAESVAELVAAKSEKAAAAAYRQLQGSLKDLIGKLRTELIEALAWLEMSSDFVEEDIEFKRVEEIGGKLDGMLELITSLERAYDRARIIRDGLIVAIVGAPNTGKSSLFNRLLARERAIVTAIPGTTRDSIREYINLAGYPVCLVDTAGIRQTEDVVETIGIDRTVRQLEDSDLVFWVLDGAVGFTEDDRRIQMLLADHLVVALVNKSDIGTQETLGQCRKSVEMARCFVISAASGDGVDSLIQWIIANYLSLGTDRQLYPFLLNQRHLVALETAKKHVQLAREAINQHESHEFAAFDVRKAADFLGEITGETTPDDVLGKIFADFCVGK